MIQIINTDKISEYTWLWVMRMPDKGQKTITSWTWPHLPGTLNPTRAILST